MNLLSYILPYPYEAYTKFNRTQNSFEDFKRIRYAWVKNNTSLRDILLNIESAFSYVKSNEEHQNIKAWFLDHSDKLRYIGDFSGLDFGIQFYEESENISIRFPSCIEKEDRQLYPSYDEHVFKSMKFIDKLEWLYDHCEFIPFRIIYEDISFYGNTSHKFSHIKKDKFAMNLLATYLIQIKSQPKDDNYYFICFDSKKHIHYLKRDLTKSKL